MNDGKEFDYLVRKALTEGEDIVKLDNTLTHKAISRLSSQKGRYKINMSKIKNIHATPFGKIATACCCMVLVLSVSFTFIQPVRAIGEKGIDTIKSMVYDVIKGKDGKYIAVKVPYDKTEKGYSSNSAVNEGNVKKIIGDDVISNIPKSLEGGYIFDHQAFGSYDPKSDSFTMVSLKDNVTEKSPDKFKETVSVFYSKAKSQIVLEISGFDTPFALNMKNERIAGDNKKSFSIWEIAATYAEYPGIRYPIKNDTEDRSQKPDISILHTIKWVQDGLYYTVYDFNGDLSLEDLKAAAATVIGSIK